MKTTPDLTNEFYPQPKVYKSKKKPKGLNKSGKRTTAWTEGRKTLKEIFAEKGITTCEIKLEGCLRDNFLGFAHVQRRYNYTLEELADPHNVVLACQQDHYTVDNEMPKAESEKLLQNIVDGRGW